MAPAPSSTTPKPPHTSKPSTSSPLATSIPLSQQSSNLPPQAAAAASSAIKSAMQASSTANGAKFPGNGIGIGTPGGRRAVNANGSSTTTGDENKGKRTGNGNGLPPTPTSASTVSSAGGGGGIDDDSITGDSPSTAPSTPATTLAPATHGTTNGAGGLDFGAVRTVFESKEHFTHKHPLFSKWTLYFDNASKADKAKDWTEALQRVIDFDSVEEFWGLYNNIVPPSHIPINSNYYLFKNEIRPAWEDPQNSKGGKWSVQLPREKNREGIDRWWLYTMLAAIGETFETPYLSPSSPSPPEPTSSSLEPSFFSDEVTGVIVSSRKGFYRISIWTRSSDGTTDRETIENIGKHFKYGVLGVKEGGKIGPGSGSAGGGVGMRSDMMGGIGGGALGGMGGGGAPEGGRGLTSDVEFQSHKDSQVKGGRAGKKEVWTV